MNYAEVMAYLEKVGTAQNRKVYARHGAKEPMFGVSFAELTKLKKNLKINHALALELWETRNSDARTLALMIADPVACSSKLLESWVKDVEYYLLSDYLASLTAKSPLAADKMKVWMKSKKEYVRATGYMLLANYMKNGNKLSFAERKNILHTIEKEIHASPNRARHAMNTVLIATGSYCPDLTEMAFTVAEKIGKVEVDHGETSCKTPDAKAYIEKTLAHLKKKKQ